MNRWRSRHLHLPTRKAHAADGERHTKEVTYRLVVRGELDGRFAYLFNGLKMERVEGTTELTGDVIDQAQLHGYIERIEELGLELVSVEQTKEPAYGVDDRKGTA